MSKNKSIKIKVSQLFSVFNILKELMEVNEQPFVGQAKRLLYELQGDLSYITKATKEDIEAIKERELDYGAFIVAPSHYPSEYKAILELVCGSLPEKKSRIEKLLNDE